MSGEIIGMAGTREVPESRGIEIVTVPTPSLGDRTYLATDTVPARW